jgi:hypothetical protein
MGKFAEVYTHEQREAAAIAFLDLGIRPAGRVVDMAAAGTLKHNGKPLEPFKMPEATVRDCARVVKKRRAGELASKVADDPDAVQILKKRLLSMADLEIAAEERKKDGDRDHEKMRQLARALREAAAIPDKGQPRPKPPGSNLGGEREGGDTSGGLAGPILKAAGMGGRDRSTPRNGS